MKVRNSVFFSLVVGAVYLGAAQLTLILQVLISDNGSLEKLVVLKPGDTISLLAGAVTAMGLAAVYFQIREAKRASLIAQRDARRKSVLELDSIHLFFNTAEMQKSRDLAWVYLRFLMMEDGGIDHYARFWVSNQSAPRVPGKAEVAKLFGAREASGIQHIPDGELHFAAYSWAVSSMVAFFARLYTHISLAYENDDIDEDMKIELAQVMGPFFWEYWRESLLKLADATEQEALNGVKLDPTTSYSVPYFVEPLRRLDRLRS